MSLSKPIRAFHFEDRPVNVREWPAPDANFRPTYAASRTKPAEVRQFPRTWVELESAIEARLGVFEDRYRAECREQFERGLLEGRRLQEADAQRKLDAAREQLAKLAATVNDAIAGLRASLDRDAALLASAIAESWLKQIVSLNPGAFLSALSDATAPLAHLDDIVVRLNPADYKTLADGIASGDQTALEFAGFRITPDATIAVGGAVAESRGGTVDARLSTRIDRARELIAAERHV
jgi:flagellar biosynthesis/type III secretory pathway protein FliH